MKTKLLIFSISFFLFNGNAQLSKYRFNFSAGGGTQHYNGDLGNGFTEIKDACWYGSVNTNLTYILSKSFDVGLFFSKGDYSYCQTKEMKNRMVEEQLRCDGCIDRIGMGDLSSRVSSGGLLIKYKFSNNYIFKESSFVKPYIFIGIGQSNIVDRMKKNCVKAGKYISYTGGFGLTYDITKRINLSYNMTIGCFNSDAVDQLSDGKGTDLFMQNSFMLGFRF